MTADQLARALRQLGLTQQTAAEQLGVDQSAVSRWLSGKRAIPGPVVAALQCWMLVKRKEQNP